ncbi:hybrid sensor histidine kinase/response regulator [Methylobacterium mesophilicum]|nr:ATP-binding protein [Methylobacterium mesophilicum]
MEKLEPREFSLKTFLVALSVPPMLFLGAALSSAYLRNEAGASIIAWCATCTFLAALLRTPSRLWLPLISIAGLGDFVAHWLMGTPRAAVPGIVVADIFEVLFTAAAFKRLNIKYRWYLSLRCIILLTFACLSASLLSTSFEFVWIGVSVPIHDQSLIKARSITEALDLLVALPLASSWTERNLLRSLNIQQFTQTFILTIATATASYFLLASGTPFLFLAIPLLLLATLSGGLLGSTAAVFSLSLVVRWFTFEGSGHINLPATAESAKLLVVYHLFTLTALLSAVPLGVLLARLENSAERLREVGITADRARRDAEAARDRAETAGRAKGEFLSVMSHELRTPMTGVLGLVDLLSKEPLTDGQKVYLHHIKQSGQHLLNVISDILDFSKIDSGKLEIESTSFSIKSVFEAVCATAQPLCHAKHIDFDYNFPDTAPEYVMGDPTRTQQILLNLVGNAIKFTHHGGVRLIAQHRRIDADTLRFRFDVHDTGIGIDKEKKSEIFNAFTQEDKSTARRYGGSGLGLAICKRLVVAMDGEIDFISVPRKGSTFWFEIPFQQISNSLIQYSQESNNLSLRPLRILIAEDVDLNRSIIASMLSSDKHTLAFARNGAEAVDLAAQQTFDLILMDIQMPIMDGVEATRQIRSRAGPVQNIPIIALTANVFESERRRYLAAGINACVAKPIDWSVLDETISRLTAGSQALPVIDALSTTFSVDRSNMLELEKLDRLKDKLGPDLANLLRDALEHAEHAREKIGSQDLTGREKADEMHALKGAAGMLGLSALQRLAEEFETQARVDDGASGSGSALREVILETEAALIRHRFLDGAKTTQ